MILRMVVTDVFVFAVCLLTFAYFHHVRVDYLEPTLLFTPTPIPPTPIPTPTESFTEPTTQATPDSQNAPTTPTPRLNDLLRGAYADRFCETPTFTENGYRSENISLTINKVFDGRATYFVADIYIRDIHCLRSGVAQELIENNKMDALELATLNDAIVSITGDYFVFRKTGNVAVRNGREWMRKEPLSSDILVLYYDGTMEVYYSDNWPDLDAIYARSPYQIWCFGPVLVDDGQIPRAYNTTVANTNPRSAIGYYEPGHYCFVLVDGRQKGYSLGMTMRELSDLFMSLGCRYAFNLDGGDTAVMTYRDALLSHPEDPRKVSDIVYIGELDTVATKE